MGRWRFFLPIPRPIDARRELPWWHERLGVLMTEKNERSTAVDEPPQANTGPATSPQRRKSAVPPDVDAERVTVNLTPRSVRALHNIVAWTGHNKTDAINRALQVYEFVQQVMEDGGSVHVRQGQDAELERLTFF
jgi:hypothetical protein